MKQFIYADNAATTKLDSDALEAMMPWLTENYGNASQPYSFGKKAARAIKEARQTVAECINAEPEQIYFTSGGSESDNWVIKCIGAAPSDEKIVATSEIEHHAILNACQNAANTEVHYLPVNNQGLVEPLDIDKVFAFSGSGIVKLVSVMMSNNEIGTIMPVKELAEAAHRNGAFFHTDAVQAVGHIPIDVKAMGIDMLSSSAHKFNGPKGIGFFYDNGRHVYRHNDGGAQEFGMRAGTENVASIVGMAAALKKNCAEMQANAKHISGLESMLLEMLKVSDLDFIRNGAPDHIPGNISLSFRGADGEAILHRMDLMGICISTGSACDSVNPQLSHVISAIKVPDEYAHGTIRISLGKYNTEDDVIGIANALNKILG